MRNPNTAPAINNLLAALPQKEQRQLLAATEQVELVYGEILYEPGQKIRHVYFPSNALVSLLTIVDGHQALEVGLVGREGMLGLPVALEISTSPVRALVQGSGSALRMDTTRFLRHLQLSKALTHELNLYTASLMAQITQTAACNRFHVVEARLARWLLMTHDRVSVNPFRMTQEFLAHMLGVRRVGVTKAARALQAKRLIAYSRGNISILNRKGLEGASCSCYAIVKDIQRTA